MVMITALSSGLPWAGRESGPVGARVVDHLDRDVGGEHRHPALREVQQPGAPPDQHQGQRDRGVDHPEADPAERELKELDHLSSLLVG
jgi:hypothetical protein